MLDAPDEEVRRALAALAAARRRGQPPFRPERVERIASLRAERDPERRARELRAVTQELLDEIAAGPAPATRPDLRQEARLSEAGRAMVAAALARLLDDALAEVAHEVERALSAGRAVPAAKAMRPRAGRLAV